MATMNISLPEPMRDWVKTQTDTGLYSNSSDYVRDLIRRDQQRAEKVKAFQAAIDQGIASGKPKAFSVDRFLSRMKDSLPNG